MTSLVRTCLESGPVPLADSLHRHENCSKRKLEKIGSCYRIGRWVGVYISSRGSRAERLDFGAVVSFVAVARLELSRIAGLLSMVWDGGSCALVGEMTITNAMVFLVVVGEKMNFQVYVNMHRTIWARVRKTCRVLETTLRWFGCGGLVFCIRPSFTGPQTT